MERRTIRELLNLLEELKKEGAIEESEYQALHESLDIHASSEESLEIMLGTIDFLGATVTTDEAYEYLETLKNRNNSSQPGK